MGCRLVSLASNLSSKLGSLLSFLFPSQKYNATKSLSVMVSDFENAEIAPDPNIDASEAEICKPDDWTSETISIASILYKGVMENGR